MAEAIAAPTPAPPKRRRWLRAISWIFGGLIVLLVVLYFVATSSGFFKSVILPKVSAALNANITVSDASISPFRRVVLRGLRVQTTGTEPLVTAAEVRLRYSLMAIIGGRINVDEITLTTPTVNLVENPDKTSNLDPILKSQEPSKPAPPSAPSKPMQVDIKKIALTDATVRQVKLHASGTRDLTELSHLNVTIENVKNGQTAKLTVASDVQLNQNPPPPGPKGALQAKLNGGFSFALTPDLKPASVQGNTRLDVTRAEGALAQAAALGANLDCDITPTEIKQVAVRLQQANTRLGEILVNGPFSLEKTEGRLSVQVLNIDQHLLNIAGAGSGIDFGTTKINSTNEVQLAKGGAAVTVIGQFNLGALQLIRTNQPTPPLDLRADYNVNVDSAASNILVRTFNLSGTQKGNQFLRGELTSPMSISMGQAASELGDSALKVTVTRFDLADWKALLGDVAPAGEVNATLQLLAQHGGKQLNFDANSRIDNLTVGSGSNQISQATVTLNLRGQAIDLKQFSFPEYQLEMARLNQPLMTVAGSGTYNQTNQNADVQLNGQLQLARLLQAFPRPDIKVSSGNADFKLRVVQKGLPITDPNQLPPAIRDITGNFTLTNLTGIIASNVFAQFGTVADLDVGMTPREVQIRKITGRITEGVNAGGTFNLSGTYDLTNESAQLSARLADFNQAGLRPFLQPMLGDKKLVSVALNANASAQYNPRSASAVKANLQVTNLVVNDPTGQLPARPLAAGMLVDASLSNQVAEVRQFQVTLTPTARATNQVQLTGRVDMTNTNAIQGHLKLAADSLDFTSYYDLFGGEKKPAGTLIASAPATSPPSSAGPAAETEPEPKQLPLTNFTAEATIGRLFLREVDIANLQTVTKINGGRVTVTPCKLRLNGAPVTAAVDLDLGVPGFKYKTSFSALAIPLAPLVNSFQPDRKGQVGGTFSGQADISGVGTTGTNLQKYLSGQFDAGSTNLNLSVVNIRSPLLKALINVVAMIPELARNPEAGVSSLVSSLLPGQGAAKTGGLSNELEKSPINQIAARGLITNGVLTLQQAMVQSSVFQADAGGTVTLQPILTNSIVQIPVSVSLGRSVAERLNLAANTPSNVAYVKLPDFLTMKGTVGNPKTDINKLALAGTLLKGIGGAIPGGSGKTGNLIQGLGGLLGGNAPAGTNAPGTTTNRPGGLLQGLGGLLGGNTPGTTNAPNVSTNQPSTNQSPLNNLFNGLLGPKKK
jgi:uncharacterized protein involved in outer membrane biogenesis